MTKSKMLQIIGELGEDITSLHYSIMEKTGNLKNKEREIESLFNKLIESEDSPLIKGTEVKLITSNSNEIYYSVDGVKYVYILTSEDKKEIE